MIFRSLYIVRLVLVVLLPMLLSLASAMAQTVVYQDTTTPLTVVEVPGHTYKWEIYTDAVVNFAAVPGNCPVTSATFVGGNTGSGVSVRWLQPGIYFYKVTARDASNCAMNLKLGMIKVIPKEILIVLGFEESIIGACQLLKLDASQSIGDIVKYEWSLIGQGGALTRQTGIDTEFSLSPNYQGTLPADFKVRLFITDRSGNTQSDTINITVDRPPVAALTTSGQLEDDGTMIADGTASSGATITYKWTTTEGEIIGADNNTTAKLFGTGMYRLQITDKYGCQDTYDYLLPANIYQINAMPDYARTSWSKDTTINVLDNDHSSTGLIHGSVRIIEQPTLGTVKENTNGTITYIPVERHPGRDQFVYRVCDTANLCDSATVTIDIYDSEIVIPQGFSPNGDGVNDLMEFKGLDKYLQSQLSIYTRSGLIVYQSVDYQNNWDGTSISSSMSKGEVVPTGTYYYVLKLGGTNRIVRGFIYIAY